MVVGPDIILYTLVVSNWEAIRRCKKLIYINNQNRNKNTNRAKIDYMRNYQQEMKTKQNKNCKPQKYRVCEKVLVQNKNKTKAKYILGAVQRTL